MGHPAEDKERHEKVELKADTPSPGPTLATVPRCGACFFRGMSRAVETWQASTK